MRLTLEAAMLFHDRKEAARLLAGKLAPYRGTRPLVLGRPQSGLLLAREVAEELEGELDVVLVRELRPPDRQGAAIGAVAETGTCILSGLPPARALPGDYIDAEKREALAELRSRRDFFTPSRPAVVPAGRVTILVEDGVAADVGAEAALRAAREAGPARLVVAAAVAPAGVVESLRGKADEVVCLVQPDYFGSVSRWFVDLPEASDEEVVAALRSAP